MAPPPSASASAASSQVPYIGSTISLLSKAGIRYEGFLHSIDQKEASVTLDHVRIFGTEDRQCDRRVPASSDTFEYIIFRAADITELRVIDTPLSRPVPDPAIIRVQVKPSGGSGAPGSSSGGDASGGRAGGGAAFGGGSGSGGRRRQTRGSSAGQSVGRSGRSQNRQQQHQPPSHTQPQHLLPPPPMMQLPVQSPQQASRSRNDWYSWYSVSYRGNSAAGGNNGGAGYYPQYRPPSMYPAAEFAAAASNGYPMRPHQPGPGPIGIGGGASGGGRPVMHFRRYHNNAQRRLSPRVIGGGVGINSGGGGGGRGRNSRRSHQSNGIAEASAHPAKYFSADYDFETANAEMAKLLLTAVNSTSNGVAGNHLVNGGDDVTTAGEEAVIAVSDGPATSAAGFSASAAAAATASATASADGHCGYDRERSFYDDISRVDLDAGAAAGGDSARLGRKEAARQNALNRETFGLSGRRFHANHQHHRGVPQMARRSPV